MRRAHLNSKGVDGLGANTGELDGSRWRLAFLFAGGTLLAGMLVGFVSSTLVGSGAGFRPGLTLPPIAPPAWFFGAVWIVIYPSLGIATWLVWQRKRLEDVRGAMSLFAVMLFSSYMFLPMSAIAEGDPAVLTLMDLNGLIVAYVTAWFYSRHSTVAVWWLTPLLLWMPLTTLLKVWLWILNL